VPSAAEEKMSNLLEGFKYQIDRNCGGKKGGALNLASNRGTSQAKVKNLTRNLVTATFQNTHLSQIKHSNL